MKKMIRLAVILSAVVFCMFINVGALHAQSMWVTGYYPDWANIPTPGNIDWKTWTHIVHFAVTPTMTYQPDPAHPEQVHYTFINGRSTFENATGNQNYPVQRQLIDTAHAHGRKVLLGYNGAAGNYIYWEQMYNQSPETLKVFISSTLKYARSRGYDGVDIDWEWPGSTAEGVIWNFFVKTLRDTLNTWNPPGTLSAAWFQWVAQLSPNIDWNLMNTAMDQMNIMCYDMEYGSRNVIHAPLYPTDCSMLPAGIGYGTKGDNVVELVHQYILKGASKSKLGVGIPFYGYQHNGSADFCTSSGGGSQVTYAGGVYPLYQSNPSYYTFDTTTQTPYLHWTDGSGGHFISFDDSLSTAAKAAWAKSQGLGGLMVWEMDQDKYIGKKGLLTNGITRGLNGAITPPGSDSLPPVVSISSPSNNTTVGGALAITVSASDNVGVSRVDFMVNGVVQASVNTSPFTYDWTTAGLVGTKTLTARAYDAAGNNTLSAPVSVSVSNLPSNPTNIALLKVVTASSVQASSSMVPQNAVDGNMTTRWASQYSDPQWLMIDLGASQKIDSVMLDWESAYATSYKIQTSPDSTNWADAWWTTTGTGGMVQLKLAPVNARYVRMYGTKRSSQYGYSVYEMQVFSPGGVTGIGPGIPVLVSPAIGATNQPLALNLTWNASSGASSYRVQLSDTSSFGTRLVDDSTLTVTTRTISGLANGKIYYWRVDAKNTTGTSSWSSASSFRTIDLIPVAPGLVAPSNGATNQPLTLFLTWNASSGASSYRVQLADSLSFGTKLVDDSTLSAPTRAVSGLTNGKAYYWRVDSKNAAGTSPWSSVNNFTTLPLAVDTTAPVVVLTSPGAGSKLSGTVTISANATDNTGVTRVQFYAGATLIGNDSTAPYSVQWNSATLANGTYTFTARGIDAAGNVGVSAAGNATVANAGIDLWVYQDGAINAPWTDKSWGGTVNVFNSTAQVYQGGSSIKVTQGHWGAASFLNGDWSTATAIDASAYQSLDFAIYAPSPLVNLTVGLNGLGKRYLIGPQPANRWITVSVPMSAMYGRTTLFTQMYITDLNDYTSTVYYLDNIRLVKASSNPPAVAQHDPTVSVVKDDFGTPDHFDLSQNYPNPFNPTTTFNFSLPQSSGVTISMFNTLGQQVRTLIDGQSMGKGEYRLTVDASQLSSGIYFCRISAQTDAGGGLPASTYVAVKRMLLVK